jgi:hypothetical protein
VLPTLSTCNTSPLPSAHDAHKPMHARHDEPAQLNQQRHDGAAYGTRRTPHTMHTSARTGTGMGMGMGMRMGTGMGTGTFGLSG